MNSRLKVSNRKLSASSRKMNNAQKSWKLLRKKRSRWKHSIRRSWLRMKRCLSDCKLRMELAVSLNCRNSRMILSKCGNVVVMSILLLLLRLLSCSSQRRPSAWWGNLNKESMERAWLTNKEESQSLRKKYRIYVKLWHHEWISMNSKHRRTSSTQMPKLKNWHNLTMTYIMTERAMTNDWPSLRRLNKVARTIKQSMTNDWPS